jgi:hypothetical protein
MNRKVLYKVFMWGFFLLYGCVAFISFCHAIQFFDIGNVRWMSVMLAGTFELGLALSLASILLTDENKKATLPWILTTVLTIVQVIGNVYSVYKYIAESNTDYYVYLANPLLFFLEDISQGTVMIIISWIMGAILPIISLFMVDMAASNIKHASRSKDTDEPPTVEPKEETIGGNDTNQNQAENATKEEPVEHNNEKNIDTKEIPQEKSTIDDIATKIKRVFKKTKESSQDSKKKVDDHYFETYEPKEKGNSK